MSRSSRSSGGGGSNRSSSSGGSRGFSGGMSSSSRSGRSSRPSSSRQPSSNHFSYRRPSGPTFINYNNSYPSRRRSTHIPHYDSGYGSPMKVIMTIIVVITIASLLASITSVNANEFKNYTKREALSTSMSTETKYFTDELGWIKKSSVLEKGMKEFYKKTGVQPHLYITNNIYNDKNPDNKKVEEFLNAKYDELFKDEAHLLLVFLDNGDDWGSWIMTGNVAKSVIDNEAQDFIHALINKYATSDLEDEEMFSMVFSKSADLLMTVYKSPWPTMLMIIAIVGISAGVVIIVIKSKLKKKELEVEQDKYNKEILNTPLEEIKPNDISDDLMDKYR